MSTKKLIIHFFCLLLVIATTFTSKVVTAEDGGTNVFFPNSKCSKGKRKRKICVKLGCKFVKRSNNCITKRQNKKKPGEDDGNVEKIKRILFVGNSFTYYNDMPISLFKKIAISLGKKVIVNTNGKQGGSTLGSNLFSQKTKKAVRKYVSYTHIVLQEQSAMLQFSSYNTRYAQTYRHVPAWNKICVAKKATPVLFQTWAYYNGYGVYDTYQAMQTRLLYGYNGLQAKFNVLGGKDSVIAHVGSAWSMAYENLQDKSALYNYDGRHPGKLGSYLAALTIYCTIYRESPIGAYIPSGISANISAQVQEYAWLACDK